MLPVINFLTIVKLVYFVSRVTVGLAVNRTCVFSAHPLRGACLLKDLLHNSSVFSTFNTKCENHFSPHLYIENDIFCSFSWILVKTLNVCSSHHTKVTPHCRGSFATETTALLSLVTLWMRAVFQTYVSWRSRKRCTCLSALQSHRDFTGSTVSYIGGINSGDYKTQGHRRSKAKQSRAGGSIEANDECNSV